MAVDLAPVCDLGTPAEISATTKAYLHDNFRIILIALRDGATFGVEQEHFPEEDLPQPMGWPDVTMLTCRVCHSKIG
jgi:hypothetical protein